jgi:hypothetical protein
MFTEPACLLWLLFASSGAGAGPPVHVEASPAVLLDRKNTVGGWESTQASSTILPRAGPGSSCT